LDPVIEKRGHSASESLQEVLIHNRVSGEGGVYAVCSAHPWVIDAAIHRAIENRSVLHMESSSSQVNQLGSYSGQTPSQFADFVYAAARRIGLPEDRILLGGDHLGPFPWRGEAANSALSKACELTRACVRAGYRKIHLDAGMACADDARALPEPVVASRAAVLCQATEEAANSLPSGSDFPLYVIGTEVPAPGGESARGEPPAVTTLESLYQTLQVFQQAFEEKGLSAAWQRVVGVVVQPGVEFGDDVVFEYDRAQAHSLAEGLPHSPSLVYEAHSTDYQSPSALAQMVEDHFAILKVGPCLSFAFREAVFALSAIERELLAGEKSQMLSQLREVLDQAMLREPAYWRSYYSGNEGQLRVSRAYSYSDRCRYYWHESSVQAEITRLIENLTALSVPLTLISQYLPLEYKAIRAGEIANQPEAIIRYHIQLVLRAYAAACGTT
jgi:D-tagatose-1,6-bisphosphate aldolase subunit GatZ/KbaZ